MSRVFVVQEALKQGVAGPRPVVDISPAAKYGELVYLLNWSDAKLKNPDAVASTLWQKLSTFSDDDYLLMVGSPTAMALTAAIAMDINNGRARLLMWDRDDRAYRVVPIDLDATYPAQEMAV
jgi:hypothetical protein